MSKRRRRKRINRPLWGILGVLLGAGLGSAAVCAYLQSGVAYSFATVFRARLMDLLVVAWLFWIGSSVGSFLNVVAWRLPRGRSIGGRSHCPYCDVQLKGRDNIPVFGWIALRGRCRSCRLPISAHYPIVELVCGLMFVLFGFVELWRGGVNLPYFDRPHIGAGPVTVPWINAHLVALVVFHATALANLFAFGLMRFSRVAVASRWLLWSLLAAVVPVLLYPPLRVIPWQLRRGAAPVTDYLDSAIYVICGLAAGGVLGRYLSRSLFPQADPKLQPLGGDTQRLIELIVAFGVVAVVMGWQTLFGVVPLALLGALLLSKYVRRREPISLVLLCLAPTMAFYLVAWRYFEAIPVWPGADRNPFTAIGGAVIAWGIALFLKPTAPDRPEVVSPSGGTDAVDATGMAD